MPDARSLGRREVEQLENVPTFSRVRTSVEHLLKILAAVEPVGAAPGRHGRLEVHLPYLLKLHALLEPGVVGQHADRIAVVIRARLALEREAAVVAVEHGVEMLFVLRAQARAAGSGRERGDRELPRVAARRPGSLRGAGSDARALGVSARRRVGEGGQGHQPQREHRRHENPCRRLQRPPALLPLASHGDLLRPGPPAAGGAGPVRVSGALFLAPARIADKDALLL